ncbi:MAG: serine--tRNA ligase [Methanomicrobiales archaeon]|nr:serine--tRNA ligase [Methanomicrobiales archaeon]
MFVRFRLRATLTFSSDLAGDAEEALIGLVDEANRVTFRRGVPAGTPDDMVGRITGWEVCGPSLVLTIESGPYTRAHDAIFRFKKQAMITLGRLRIGLRGISVETFTLTLEGVKPGSFHPEKIPFITDVEWEGETLHLTLTLSPADLEERVPDRIVRLIEEKLKAADYGGKAEHWELIFESRERTHPFTGDPTAEMEKRGWIKHALWRGQWIYGPQSVQLIRALETIVIEEVIGPLGFSEMIFPKLVPWEVWKRSGHAKGVYPEIYYVCTPKTRDPAYWEEVADHFKVTGEVPIEKIRERIDGPIGGLCYAQCPSFWPFIQGSTLADDCLPIRVFDRSGTSHRYESGGIHGIERVDEFHRIEILWLGTPEQTVAIADQLHEAYHRIFEEVLGLQWRCARVTPWFMAQEGMVDSSPDSCGCGARVGTTDYEALLPYSGSWLEFQNVSINGDKYPTGFGVKVQSKAECWSGCSGIGLERWTAAFLAQKGLDQEHWPARVAELTGEPKDLFRIL